MTIFTELTIIILVATVVSVLMKFLKQPFVVGYILTGIIVGPYFLNILHSKENIELFSKIGITILLFIVGLHLNPGVIKEVGKISLATGLGQVIFTSIIGYFICIALGIPPIASIYIAIALTFSSTIIILKLLSDKGDLDKLYGKIAIGFLLVQDLVATIILIAVTTLASTAGESNLALLTANIIFKGIVLSILLYLVNRYLVSGILGFMAKSQELLFLFSIGWGLGVASIFMFAGFSAEIGALAAGITLSTSTYAIEIGSRMKPLRDFFIILFFILLGSQMVLASIPNILLPASILSIFVLAGNPFIVIILMNLLGYKRKTGFMAGLTVAQISEFSLILATLGVSVGHLTSDHLSLVTLVGLLTIAGSSYLIIYSEYIYKLCDPLLKGLEIRKVSREKQIKGSTNNEIILFGYDRVGRDFVEAIKKLEKSFIVVDFNPNSIKKLSAESVPNAFGDAEDIEFLDELNIKNAKLVISTIPDSDTNKLLVRKLSNENPTAITVVISHNAIQAKELYDLGATYVILPHYLGAEFAASMIKKIGIDKKGFLEAQKKHKDKLFRRLDNN